MNAACGPPNPIGTPKRCDDPTQISAPNEPGDLSTVSASRSAATMATAPAAFALVKKPEKSSMRPRVSGYWTNTAKTEPSAGNS
jgi:hypothetical protein